MKNHGFLKRLGDFALGKGFYIVLFLCVAAIGISGYYLIRSFDRGPGALPAASAAGNAEVTLPDPVEEHTAPVVTVPPAPDRASEPEPQPAETPAQQDAVPETPAPAAPAKPTAEPEPRKPAAVVYTWPVNGEILRDFSVETLALDPTLGDWRVHGGVDIAAAEGTQVIAMRAGSVSQVYEDGLMGHTVMLDHGDGLVSIYCGLGENIPVKTGDAVETGTVLGTVGNTAIAESGVSSHLHLETLMDGEWANPVDYLPQR